MKLKKLPFCKSVIIFPFYAAYSLDMKGRTRRGNMGKKIQKRFKSSVGIKGFVGVLYCNGGIIAGIGDASL